jgi:hypothetical protein
VNDVRTKSGDPVSGRRLCWGASLVAIAAAANGCHARIATRASTPAKPSEAPPLIVELASHENLLYVRRANGRLYRWDTATGDTRLLEQEGFVAIAPDGSVAVTHKKLEPRGSRVEVWDLATERLLRTRVFGNGADRFLVAKGAVLLVESEPPRPPGPPMPPRSLVELPIVDTTLWNLQSDQLRKVRGFDPHPSTGCRFAPAGLRLACANWRGLSWRDLDHPQWDGSIALAPEWKEPRTDIVLTYISKPQAEPPWTFWESLAWTGDGNRIVLAYARSGDPPECRLERWTPGDQAKAGKDSERLATVHRRCNIKVLAASRDGNRFVTSEYPSHLVLRRAPKYEAIEIAPVDATQAAFLPGDERFVTAHRDGLQLWDARTLGLLAKWP